MMLSGHIHMLLVKSATATATAGGRRVAASRSRPYVAGGGGMGGRRGSIGAITATTDNWSHLEIARRRWFVSSTSSSTFQTGAGDRTTPARPTSRGPLRRSLSSISLTAQMDEAVRTAGHRLRDALRTGGLSTPPNPIVVGMDGLLPPSSDDGQREGEEEDDAARMIHYPDFDSIEPRHFVPAAGEVAERTLPAYEALDELARQLLERHESSSEGNQSPEDIPYEDVILPALDGIDLPFRFLDRLLHLYATVQRDDSGEVRRAREGLDAILSTAPRVPPSCLVLARLALDRLEGDEGDDDEDGRVEEKVRALRSLLSAHALVPSGDGPDSDDQQDKDESTSDDLGEDHAERWQSLLDREAEVSRQLSFAASHARSQPPEIGMVLPPVYEALAVRSERARFLGYPSYLEMYLDQHMMAPDLASITEVHDAIADATLPRALAAVENIQAEEKSKRREAGKKKRKRKKDEPYFPFDVTKKPDVWFHLTPYLELDNVLEGMFDLSRRLFGVTVREVTGGGKNGDDAQLPPSVWHRDVRLFEIYDEDGEDGGEGRHLASFYLDPYSRPENKDLNGAPACTVPLVDRGPAVATDDAAADGERATPPMMLPLSCMALDVNPPVWNDSPCLLSFGEFQDLMHEFGHVLQHALTAGDERRPASVTGTNGVEADAAEVPAMFMQRWCHDPRTLRSVAKHWKTGEPAPSAMLEELEKERIGREPFRVLQLIYESQLELELCGNFDAGGGESVLDVQERIRRRYTPYNEPGRGDPSTLACIFAEGGDGGGDSASRFQYRYLWSDVLTADLFSAFAAANGAVDEEEAVGRLGRRFRDTVLGVGGAGHPSLVFRRFRDGRSGDAGAGGGEDGDAASRLDGGMDRRPIDAFLEQSGLA